MRHGYYFISGCVVNKDLVDAGQAACADSNLRCIYSACVCEWQSRLR